MLEHLTQYQRESLASWYRIGRFTTEGYYPREFSDRKPTMDKFFGWGIIEQPHRGGSDYWRAKVTPEGLELAKQCNAIIDPDIPRDPCGCEVATTPFRHVILPCPEHEIRLTPT